MPVVIMLMTRQMRGGTMIDTQSNNTARKWYLKFATEKWKVELLALLTM